MTTLKIRNTLNVVAAVAVSMIGLVAVATVLGVKTTKAADVVSYIDLAANGAGPVAPATITTNPEVAVSTADEFYFSYTASATEFAIADEITIDVPVSFTGVAACAASTTDADQDTTADGAVAVAGNEVTYTFTAATTTAATGGVEICFAATTPASNGNYSISITDNNDSDVSAALIYVGPTATTEADENEVLVTAVVPVVLELAIYETSTTTTTSECDLGVLNPGAVNTCSYRVAAGTNGTAGFSLQMVADDDLNNAADTAEIDDVAADDTTVDAGTEEYGFDFTLGADADLAATGVYGNGTPDIVPSLTNTIGQTEILAATGAVDASVATGELNWNTVTHSASISSATEAGSYDQLVDYFLYYAL